MKKTKKKIKKSRNKYKKNSWIRTTPDGKKVRVTRVAKGKYRIRVLKRKTKQKVKVKYKGKTYVAPKTIKKGKIRKKDSDKYYDALYTALPPGKRVSKKGKVYYEYRATHSDENNKIKL